MFGMSWQHLLWHLVTQVSIIVCATSPTMNSSTAVMYPEKLPVVVISTATNDAHKIEYMEIQQPGMYGQVLVNCFKTIKTAETPDKFVCQVNRGHTLEEAMTVLGQAVIQQNELLKMRVQHYQDHMEYQEWPKPANRSPMVIPPPTGIIYQ